MSDLLIKRDNCRLCSSKNISVVVPLAPIPILSPNVGTDLSDADRDALTAPIDLYLCDDCGLLQLTSIIDPSFQYADFRYRTSVSLGLSDHFATFAADRISQLGLGAGAFVLDIGSNDGTLLRFFKTGGMKVLGIDPAAVIAAEATASGIPTLGTFFTAQSARQIRDEHGAATLIVSNNTMANLDNLDDMISGIRLCLADDGVYIFETQYALDVLEKTLLDVIYHEHLSYFAISPLAKFFAARKLEIIDAERIAPKGGSIRVTVQHANGPRPISPRVAELMALEAEKGLFDHNIYQKFAAKIAHLRESIRDAINGVDQAGKEVAIYGSSVGCASLINQFELGKKVKFIVDDTPFKDELTGPDYRLPILSRDALLERRPGLVIVLAWRYAAPIAEKNSAYLNSGGRFLIPLPDISYLP